MDAVFKKLNYKEQKIVHILNSPKSFETNIESIKEKANIHRELSTQEDVEFFIGFTMTQSELDRYIGSICPRLSGDAVVWICYPKMSSKKYVCEFNRNTGWAKFGNYNLEPVRGVAIDDDWSALRFRRVEFIKKLTRDKNYILSEKGKTKGDKA